jgi:hypothetical protein
MVPESFMTLYRMLMRRDLGEGPKAALWQQKYRGRYVRWTGRIASFTPNGLTIRERPSAITFDVSLWLEPAERVKVRAHYKRGDTVTYIGRLDTYDDVLRTFYLIHGGVVFDHPPDGGAPLEDE